MVDRNLIKEKTSAIYDVLPKFNDQRCGYKSCGEFARAVAEGRAPCYGCIMGGPEVARQVCEIMGAPVKDAVFQFSVGRNMDEGMDLNRLRGQGSKRGMGIGRGGGMARGGPGRGRGGGMGMGRSRRWL